MSEGFPRTARLRKRADYLEVQRRGRKVQSDHFFLLHVPSPSDRARARIGVTISSKVGGAVVRNRLKRWVREYVRRHRAELPAGEVVVIGKTSAAGATHPIVDTDLGKLFGKARQARGGGK